MHRHSPIRKLTGLFAGLLKCWHGHLLNSGTWIRLVLAGRPEQWVHSARLNRCGDERTGFAFDPLSKKKILVLGVCGFVVRGWRGGQRLYRCPRQAARFAARRTVHTSMDRPLAVDPCKPRARLPRQSQSVRGHSHAGQSPRQEFRDRLRQQPIPRYFNAFARSWSVTFPDWCSHNRIPSGFGILRPDS